MICVFGFCGKDKHLAIQWANWVDELGGVRGHDCLLVYQQGEKPDGVLQPLQHAFRKVWALECYDDASTWPAGPNIMWQIAAQQIQCPKPKNKPWPYPDRQPWLWMEPDAIPLSPRWMDEIEHDYIQGGKAFMGDLVNAFTAGDPTVTPHMSGIGVYPEQIVNYTDRFNGLEGEAWDTYFARDFLHNFHQTKLIHHLFWEKRDPNTAPSFNTEQDLLKIRPEAVIYHRVKDSTKLISMLREKMFAVDKSGLSRGLTSSSIVGSNPTCEHRTIHCYYEPTQDIDETEQRKLIDIWKTEWTAHGWNPVVLNESDAAKHPLCNRARIIFNSFPTINPKGYDMGCWLRYMAVSAAGGGWMSDYDVLPLKMDVSVKGLTFFSGNENDPNIPCLVYGEKSDYDALITFLLLSQNDGKHHSDMIALRTLDLPYENQMNVKEYGEDGWSNGVAVHYSTHAMSKANRMPKSKNIPASLMLSKGTGSSVQVDPEKEAMRAELEKLRAQVGSPPSTKSAVKPKRTAAEQAVIDTRMAKARAGRNKLATV